MPTNYEKKADAIGRQLVKALKQLESFDGDPEMVLDSAEITANSECKGVKEALQALRVHYLQGT